MCRVTDAQQPGPVPAWQPVHPNGQLVDGVPVVDPPDPVGQAWRQRRDARLQRGQAGLTQLAVRLGGDGVRELPVVTAIDGDQHPTATLEERHVVVGAPR